VPALVRVEPDMTRQSFASIHQRVISQIIEELKERIALRIADILKVEHCKDHNELFETIWQGCHQQHQRFNIKTNTGVRVSIGFVRWSQIAVTRNCARYMSSKSPEHNTLHKIICYHSRHMLCIRNEIEIFLDSVGDRRGADGSKNNLLDDPHVQAAVTEAESMGMQNVMIIVVCSPIMEIGRDYDFDWSINDPSGLRMLIQACGRLGRHSNYHGCITALVLSEPYLALKNRWNDHPEKAAYIYPGVEEQPSPMKTNPDEKWRLRNDDGEFITLAEEVFDMTTLREVVDARDCLQQPDQSTNKIGWLEHEKLKDELIENEISVCNWFEGSMLARMTNRHQKRCMFRWNSMQSLVVWRTGADEAAPWKKSFEGGNAQRTNVANATQGDSFLLPLDSVSNFNRLAEKIQSKDIFKDLCGFEFRRDSQNIEYSDQLGGGETD
jgi:CRISPR-associated endonuclease/helicase Cas3